MFFSRILGTKSWRPSSQPLTPEDAGIPLGLPGLAPFTGAVASGADWEQGAFVVGFSMKLALWTETQFGVGP